MIEIYSVEYYVNRIENVDTQKKIADLYALAKKKKFGILPAAKRMHHDYACGLSEHTAEVIALALELNKMVGNVYHKDEVIIAALLHDFDKLYSYRFVENNEIETNKTHITGTSLVLRLCAKVGYVPSVNIVSAIEFAHGGWSLAAKDKYVQPTELHAIIHCADMLSTYFGTVGGIYWKKKRGSVGDKK